MIHVSWHTDCPDGEGLDSSEPRICHPCRPGWYASAINDRCLLCPFGKTNGVYGATDASGCTST